MRKRVHVLRTDGSGRLYDVEDETLLDQVRELIGASGLDFVNLRDGRLMAVDDNGYRTELVDHGGGRFENRCVEALKPKNAQATALYHKVCVPGTTHEIVGDVAIFKASE